MRALGGWDTPIVVTHPDDIGRGVTEVVFAEPAVSDRTVYLASESTTYAGIAEAVEKATGKKWKKEELSVPYLKGESAKDPENGLKQYQVVFAAGQGTAWRFERTLNAKLGVKSVSIENFARSVLV